MSEAQQQPGRSVKHGLGAWFGAGPRRHGEPIVGRSVSYLELFYDLVFVVLVGQAAHTLAAHPGWRGLAEFAAVFGLVWIAWINGTLYHELHGREDGRSRAYVFAQMAVLAVLGVFTGYAGTVDGTPFALTYSVLLVLLFWQWYEVRRSDLPEHRPASTPYLLGLAATITVMVASAWLPDTGRIVAWLAVVAGWVVLGVAGFVGRSRPLTFFEATESLVERMALFVIIVLGETVVGVVNGIGETERDPLTIATGVLGLGIGFGIFWNYFDVVGTREPRASRSALATWFFGHLPQTGAIAVTGAAMVGLVVNADEARTPSAVAWTLGGAVAVSLVLIAVESASVEQAEGIDSGTRARIYGVGAILVIVLGALAPAPWLLALLVIAVLSATWLSSFVPPPPAAEPGSSSTPTGGTTSRGRRSARPRRLAGRPTARKNEVGADVRVVESRERGHDGPGRATDLAGSARAYEPGSPGASPLKEPAVVDRSILPIPDATYDGPVYDDAKDPRAVYEPIRPVTPPPGAPNVLVVLLDDVGFGAASVFGGPCRTPTAERLAARGLSYSRFHTTALCAPTRQALLTGRNHHAVGMGAITEIATSIPGYTSVRPQSAAPLAQVLRLNGYATAQFGKCHEVPVWQTSPVGPFDAWPTGGGGFEHFYGFLGGETNQYAPAIYSGTTPIEPERTAAEGYHFTEDMTDQSIAWVRQLTALTPDRPFFMYYAPGATHAPHHVPLEWADGYRGEFDDGWDALRDRIFSAQKRRGVVPEDAELTARHDEIPSWDAMPDELKPVLARQMEVYAGFLEHTDRHIGRLIDALEALDVLENTLVFYIIGDNGASAEGHINGSFNEYLFFNGAAALETPEFLAARKDKFGTPEAYNHFSVGWAHAMDTPYQWTKQVASHWGGTRNATVVHWPQGISAAGQVRHQFHHVIDIAPTVLEAAGIPVPERVNGVEQDPLHGVSMRYSFEEPEAEDRHTTQYFEIGGNRGIYHEGWTAVTKHATPWIAIAELPAFVDDVWELYAPDDWTQSRDLSAQMPDKLHELQELFMAEARRYQVLPLDDRRVERFDAAIAGRPTLIHGRSQILYGGMGRLTEATVINTKNVSHAVAADVDIPDGGASGVIVAQGGAFGGWSLYLRQDGTPAYCYNLMGLQSTKVVGAEPLAPGRRRVAMLFDYDGGGPGRGASVTLTVDGATVATGRLERTVPLVFSLDETCDVGRDGGLAVSDDYVAEESEFTGDVESVLIEVAEGASDFSHLVDPQLRLSLALARQ